MDEKYALYFESSFTVGNRELVYPVFALSIPMVITVHANQEMQAWATITWDSAFKEPNRIPFCVPSRGPWHVLGEAMSAKFEKECGRGLQENHLMFLRDKIFNGAPPLDSPNMLMITWNQFSKELLHNREHTFWGWFHSTMRFCKESLKNEWMEGIIIGFISRVHAEERLRGCAVGTFLLRFSDGDPGGVTVAYVGEEGEILHIQPFTAKTFETRCLSDCINDLAELQILYPNTPKTVFAKFSKVQETRKSTGNYVKPIIQITIDRKSQRSAASSPFSMQSKFTQVMSPTGSIAPTM